MTRGARMAALRVGVAAVLASRAAHAQADSAVRVQWSGFVDTYYAWDLGQPPNFDRSFASGALFTTQPARHNEFNVNLAFVDVTISGTRTRGRVALQTGTSVVSNYAGEPVTGTVSGAALAQLMQEAFAGVRVAGDLWVDMGVFFSHAGLEGWISRDNATYTRSLVAEYSPYYQSGARMTWRAQPALTLTLNVVNGWQNIAENNRGKGAGLRVDWAPAASTQLSYYNLLSNEAGGLLRTLNGIGARGAAGPVKLLAQVDVGTQRSAAGTSAWHGFVVIARGDLARDVTMVARVEQFADPDGAVAPTGVASGALNADGGSIGIDVRVAPGTLWRIESRGWVNASPIFHGAGSAPRRTSALVVSSLAMSF